MGKRLSSLVLGIAGALAGCPSGQVQQERTQSVAPVQSANIHSVAPVESAVFQRSIRDETQALVGYLKKSEKPLCGLYSTTIRLGYGTVEVSLSEEKATVRNQTIRDAGIIIYQNGKYADTDCDGICDSATEPWLNWHGVVRTPSANRQQEYERLVRDIVEFYRRRDEWIEEHDDAPASRPPSNEYSARAFRLFEHVLRNGERISPDHKNYTIFECDLEADGEKYRVFLKTSSDNLREDLPCALIEKCSAFGKVIAQFSDYGVEHGLYLSPFGTCDGALISPGFLYSRGSEGLDAQTAVQLEYERTLDKLVNAINPQ